MFACNAGTKASSKTTELIAFVDEASDFGAQEAWFYVSLLTIGYMVSRGLAKSGRAGFARRGASASRARVLP